MTDLVFASECVLDPALDAGRQAAAGCLRLVAAMAALPVADSSICVAR